MPQFSNFTKSSTPRSAAGWIAGASLAVILLSLTATGCSARTSEAQPTVTVTAAAPEASPTTSPGSSPATSPSPEAAATPEAQTTPSPRATAVAEPTYDQLLTMLDSAPVPALCHLPAGTLVEGRLPVPAGSRGALNWAWIDSDLGYTRAALTAVGHFSEDDDATYVVASVWCTGGTSSTEYLLAYRSYDGKTLTLVSSFDLAFYTKFTAHASYLTAGPSSFVAEWASPGRLEGSSGLLMAERAVFTIDLNDLTPHDHIAREASQGD